MPALQFAFNAVESGYMPDSLIRSGIRRFLSERLKEIHINDTESKIKLKQHFIEMMDESPIAHLPEKANEQHYEINSNFYYEILGNRMKYSSGYWPDGVETLEESEIAALEETCNHAEIRNGMDILELGCGWGSLTLWMGQKYPSSRITAVSNSSSQKEFIEAKAKKMGISNIKVITSDMNDFSTTELYDRVVSVEMFEHMRNYRIIFKNIAGWLKAGGKFFMHIFVHRDVPYLFEDTGPSDWMSRYFFSGGIMPSDDLPLVFQDDIRFIRQWRWDGTHYERTLNEWLKKMDEKRDILAPFFEDTYGKDFKRLWWNRWRIFFMACAELFGYDEGQMWWVSHYLFEKK